MIANKGKFKSALEVIQGEIKEWCKSNGNDLPFSESLRILEQLLGDIEDLDTYDQGCEILLTDADPLF